MRDGQRLIACLSAAVLVAGAAFAEYKTTPSTAPPPTRNLIHQTRAETPRTPRAGSFRLLATEVDKQVVANLLTDAKVRTNDLPLSVMSGQVTRCREQVCVVPLTVRVTDAQGPVSLAFAVANAKGELSPVQHAECGTGACRVSLLLERGKNTISVGIFDGLAQSSAYATIRVDANRHDADSGRTEWF